jgi:hypothetical protein
VTNQVERSLVDGGRVKLRWVCGSFHRVFSSDYSSVRSSISVTISMQQEYFQNTAACVIIELRTTIFLLRSATIWNPFAMCKQDTAASTLFFFQRALLVNIHKLPTQCHSRCPSQREGQEKWHLVVTSSRAVKVVLCSELPFDPVPHIGSDLMWLRS